MLNAIRLRKQRLKAAHKLNDAVAQRSRAEVFFRDLAVPDTIDGRFDLVTLHAWLVLDALVQREEQDVARRFGDAVFARFEDALRDLGAGDMGMSRRLKAMASAFYGRLKVYREAENEAALADAILRNVYRGAVFGVEPAALLASYCRSAGASVARSALEAGEVDFGPLPLAVGSVGS